MRFGMKQCLFCSLVFLLCGLTFAKGQPQDFRFEQLSDEQGWQGNAVNSILQDHRGFLWIATWAGLFRYDGYELKAYRQDPADENGLQSNYVISLYEDKQNRLWIGTSYTGLYQYDEAIDGFINYSQEPDDMNSLSSNNVWAIVEDHLGFLWIGTENGLNRFDPNTGQFLHFFHSEKDERSLSHNFVYSLALAGERDLFVGTEGGLNRLVYNDGKPYFIRYELAPEDLSHDDYLRHNFIYRICSSQSAPNSLWLGTSIGLIRVKYFEEDLTKLEQQMYYHAADDQEKLSHHFVSSILEEPANNRLWVGTYKGLNLLDLSTGKFQQFLLDPTNINGIGNNVVRALWRDRNGLLWVGTSQGPEYINLSSNPFKRISFSEGQARNKTILGKLLGAKGRPGIWVATDGKGLHHVDVDSKIPKKVSYQLLPPSVPELAGFISSLLLDGEANLWIATKGAGLLKVKESALPVAGGEVRDLEQFTKENQLQDDYIMSLEESANEDIWLGYWDNGLSRYDRKRARFYHYQTTKDLRIDLRTFPIVNILETGTSDRNFLWLAARGNGLYQLRYDRSSDEMILLNHYQFEKGQTRGLSSNFVSDLYAQGDDYLWIGTENGVNRLQIETGEFTHFRERDGLANGAIQTIIGTGDRDYWISTQEGLSHLELLEQDFRIKNYDRYDGLGDNHYCSSSGMITPTRDLMFGGLNGLSFFQSSTLTVDTVPPKVVITDFKLYNQSVMIGEGGAHRAILEKSISNTSQLQLNHRENVLAFEFVGLQFTAPEKIKYAYQLEGFNDQWFYTDADNRVAHYMNLPYDDFVFRVKAANGDGYWSEPMEIQLKVLPPFWLTNWAFILYGVLALILLYVVWKITRMKADFRHSLQLEKLEREKLEAVNQMKLRFFTNISHELRTPLTLILTPLEQFIKEQSMNKQVHQVFSVMHQNANRLLRMINQLLDIRKSEAGLLKLQVAEGDFVKFIYEIVVSFKGVAQHRGIDLSFRTHQPQIQTWYDRDEMEKVLYNLLSNALKFTPEEGKIQVEVWVDKVDKKVVVVVQDTGPGIPQDQLPHLFDRFFSLENQIRKIEGTGVGLALSMNIVEAHHGEILVESMEGEGATFLLQLPLGDHHFTKEQKIQGFQDSEQIAAYQAQIEKPLSRLVGNGQSDQEERSTPAETTAIHQLLIVEDNPDIRALLKGRLEAEFQILEAVDGQEGWEMAHSESPDLIIADIAMPRMDGIELCAKVKSNVHTSHIPVVLLTARTSLIYQLDGLETGADDYITKPFNMQLLLARIKNLIHTRKELQQHFAKSFDLSPSGVVLNSLDEQLLSRMKLLIEENLDNADFRVEQMADALQMSRMQLYRKTKALTDFSPQQLIRHFRLQRAAQLLESGQYNVSEVTYKVGYNDLKSFRTQFKKAFGVSPSGYETKG